MQFGISQVLFRKLGPAESVRKIAAMGFDCFEVHSRFLDPRLASHEHFDEMAAAVRETGLQPAQAHMPFWSGIDIGNYNEIIRTYGLNVTKEAIARAAVLGKPKIVLHPGTWRGSSDEFLNRLFRELVIEAARELAQVAAEHGMTVCVENMLGPGPDSDITRFGAMAADLVDICGAVPEVKACLDTGHARYNDQDPADCVRELAGAGVLEAVHVQDVDEFPNDRHWLPGRGGIDWAAFVAALKDAGYDGAFMLEVSARDGEPEEVALEALALKETLGVG